MWLTRTAVLLVFLVSLAKCSAQDCSSANVCLKNSSYNLQKDSLGGVIVDARAEIDSGLRTAKEMTTGMS